MIDPATAQFKIVEFNDKQECTMANLLAQEWLFKYPRPSIIRYDCGY